MYNWQRIFAYITGGIVFGLALILVSRNFIQFIARGGTTGWLFLLGFSLIFLNLNFAVSRRFVIKAINTKWVCYLIALIMVIPTIFWTFTKDVGLEGREILFVSTIIISAFLGSFLGIMRGIVKREKYIRKAKEEEDRNMPDELKRPHDDLSKN